MSTPRADPRRFDGLGVSLLIFALALVVQGWRLSAEFQYVLAGDKTRALASQSFFSGGPVLTGLLTYLCAIVLLHVLAAVVAWGIAVAMQRALARPRAERGGLAGLSALLLLAWIMLANAEYFPQSAFATAFIGLSSAEIGPWSGFQICSAFLATTAAGALVGAALRTVHRARADTTVRGSRKPATVAALAGAVVVLSAVAVHDADARRDPVADRRPNFIIIGIDSLRCDLSGIGDPATLTPNVDQFLAGSTRFTDAVTPLARTFPAWVSILTGRHPVSTNARINLTPRHLVREGDTLAKAFARAGYATVLATDEVRFSNIDQSYGYETLITPRIGGTDFLIATFNDVPVANLATLSPLSRYLFPDLYANRAAYKTYRPEAFVQFLRAALEPDPRPMFLVTHLTLAHWPYTWSTSAGPRGLANMKNNYRDAVHEVDRQFAAVMDVLRGRGLLDNAVVVLLSDHGEAVALPNDSLLPKGYEDEIRRWSSLWGHGTSVLGPHQYRVVLGMRAFGNGLLPATGSVQNAPVTLEDVAPTLADLAGVQLRDRVEGTSLVPVMRGDPDAAARLLQRFRFTESEYNPPALAASLTGAKNAQQELAAEAARMYALNLTTGRVELTERGLREITAAKELAVLRGGQKLAATPTKGRHKYFWFDGRQPFPRTTMEREDVAADPEAASMLAALDARFPGELATP